MPATLYMDFFRTGNRHRFELPYFQRRQVLAILVLAEWLQGEGRFLDDIINGVWAICEESSWVLPAHHNQFYRTNQNDPLPRTCEPVIDLFAAETGALLAWSLHLLGQPLEQKAPAVPHRILGELGTRILDPYLRRDDFWWMGLLETSHSLGNWVPWTTGNCLRCFLLAEPDAKRRLAAVRKGLRSLDVYLGEYSPDGGCDEGPSYWGRSGGSLFECLEMLTLLTDEAFDPFQLELIQRIGQYMYKVHIAGEYFVNFADGSAKAEVEGSLLYCYGKRIADPDLCDLGAQLYQLSGLWGQLRPLTFSLGRLIRSALWHGEIEAYSKAERSVSAYHWLEHVQVITARETTTGSGFFLGAKGGHNGENHNHNDVGSYIVFYDGFPLIIDVGVETYTAQTFSAKRYELWTMRSNFHNLPIMNGRGQSPGRSFHAAHVLCRNEGDSATLTMDLSPAYPGEAGVQNLTRSLKLKRKGRARILIVDQYRLDYADSIQFVFMLAHKPQLQGDTV
ncbi:MAG TPA: heparinase, partial [Firmicutes bacterium]|nr:heparinase [Bacillota bacterium]